MEYAEKIWQTTVDTAHGLATLLYSPTSNLCWLYFASALSIAAAVYVLRGGKHSPAAILRHCLPESIYASRSFRLDVRACLTNILLHTFFLGSLILSTVWVEEQTWTLLHAVAGQPDEQWAGFTAKLALTAALILAMDFSFFLSHVLQHKLPLLWQFHKVHHSAEVLNPFTTFRRHPVDLMIDGNITGLLTGIIFGVFDYLSFGGLEMFTVAGVNTAIFVFLITTAHLQHSHVWISYGPLDRLIVSPAMHQIHHSTDARHLDRNFGNIFSFWDAITGTRYLPCSRETLACGLADANAKRYDRLWELYARPFVDARSILFMRRTMLMKSSLATIVGLAMLFTLAGSGIASDIVLKKGNDPAGVVAPMFAPKADTKAKGTKGAVAPMFTPKGDGVKGAVAPMFTPKSDGATGVVAPMFTPQSTK